MRADPHEKSPVGAAAALATLGVIEAEGLVDRSRRLGDEFLIRLQRLQAEHSVVVDVRAQGLLAGIELAEASIAEEVLYRCLSMGLSFKVSSGTVLTLTPPLTILEEDLSQAVSILNRALSEAEKPL